MTLVNFNKKLPLVIIPISIKLDTVVFDFNFAIDTGASISLIDIDVLHALGFHKKHAIGNYSNNDSKPTRNGL